MTRYRPYRVAALAAALAAGCGQDPTLPPSTFDPVRIGTISSLTGDLAELGPGWANATLLAVQEINAAGGPLPAQRADLIIEDDGTSPDGGAAAAERLLSGRGVAGIVGAPASGSSLRVAQLAGPAQVVQVSGTSTSDLLNPPGEGGDDAHPYFFRTVPPDHLQGWVFGSVARGEYNGGELDLACTTLAVTYLDNDYGRPFAEAIVARFSDLGGDVVVQVPLPPDRSTYADEVRRLIEAAPDCVGLVAYQDSGGTVIREWYAQPGAPETRWIGTDGIRGDGLTDGAGAHANGVVGTAPVTDPDTPQGRIFDEEYQVVFGEPAVTFGGAVYDAAALLLLAVAAAGSDNGEQVRSALFDVSTYAEGDFYFGPGELAQGLAAIRDGRGVDYVGASGPVDFLSNGDVVSDYEVWGCCDGDAFTRLVTIRASEIDVE